MEGDGCRDLYLQKDSPGRCCSRWCCLQTVASRKDTGRIGQREDRLQVQQDLRRIAWEKDFEDATAQLEGILVLLRDFLALPRESQILQLDTFCDAALEALAQAEEFLTRCHS